MQSTSVRAPEPLRAIRGVIFDLGHTLMWLAGTWEDAFAHGAGDLAAFVERQGLGLDGHAFAEALLERRRQGFAQARLTLREVTAEESMRWTFARFGVVDPDAELVRGAIRAFFGYEEELWQAQPQAAPVLQELARRGLRLGLYSNATDDALIQRLVDRVGFRRWLDPVLCSAATGIRKPDPAAFTPFLRAWALEPEAVLMVGDSLEEDILGARRAGLRCAWIRSRADARQEGRAADEGEVRGLALDATIAELAELLQWLEID